MGTSHRIPTLKLFPGLGGSGGRPFRHSLEPSDNLKWSLKKECQVAALCFHRCWGRITLISTDSLPRGRLSDFPVVRQPLQDNTRSPTRSSASETCPISSKPCCLSGFYDICLWELIRNSLENLVEENIDGQIHIPRHSQSCSRTLVCLEVHIAGLLLICIWSLELWGF